MTLQEYLDYLGWSLTELARQASINRHTASKAVNGEAIQPGVARAIAEALSQALNKRIYVGDIEGLNVYN